MLDDPTIISRESSYSNKYPFEWNPLSSKQLKSKWHSKLLYFFCQLLNVFKEAISVKFWYVEVIILPLAPLSKASSISLSNKINPAFFIKLTDKVNFQTSLFDDYNTKKESEQVEKTIDKLKEKFGRKIIKKASMIETKINRKYD